MIAVKAITNLPALLAIWSDDRAKVEVERINILLGKIYNFVKNKLILNIV